MEENVKSTWEVQDLVQEKECDPDLFLYQETWIEYPKNKIAQTELNSSTPV